MSINKKYIGIFLGIVLLLIAEPIYAQPTDFVGADAKGQLGLSVKDLIANLALLNTFMHVVILITLNFVQYLLQSDFFSNPAMMGALNRIWQLSRDIMNVIFALMLIGVAFYTIITADKKYVTDKLQTFVMAVILVNFSWFFPRVIIDVANVMTATIYTIPDMMTGGFSCQTWDFSGNPVEPCKAITGILLLPESRAAQDAYCPAGSSGCACSDIACYKTGSLADLRASGNAGAGHVMINGLVVNFVKILDMPKVAASVADIRTGTEREGFFQSLQIFMIIAMSFIFQLAIVLPLIGLVFGLLVRILIIWVTTAFMPFAFLGYVINGKLGTNVFDFEHDIWKEFIAAAFMPTVVAIPISIGFIMLTAATQVPAPAGSSPLLFDIPIFVSVKTWWVMLWQLAAIMIVWTGTFAALNRSKIIGGFTEKLKGYGDNIFNSMKMLPLIVPLPLPGGANLASIVNKPKQIGQAIRASAETGAPIGDSMKRVTGGGAGASQGGNRGMTTEGLTEMLNKDRKNTEDIITAIQKLGDPATSQQEHVRIMQEVIIPKLEMPGVNHLEALEKLKSAIAGPGIDQDIKAKFTQDVKDALDRGIEKAKNPGT